MDSFLPVVPMVPIGAMVAIGLKDILGRVPNRLTARCEGLVFALLTLCLHLPAAGVCSTGILSTSLS